MRNEKYVVELRNAAIYHADDPFGSRSEERLLRQGEMVLSDVNLTVAPGELVYLIGRVGSGKSTLLKTLYAEVQLLTGAMEQVPEELVKEQFDRVLKTVQETSREQVSRYQGQICDVLVEEINENDSSLVTGRMSNNTLVHFPGDISLVGKLVNVSLDECHGFYYMGHMVQS